MSWVPGRESKTFMIEVRQMVAASSSDGGAGCSRAPTPPVQAKLAKASSSIPSEHCLKSPVEAHAERDSASPRVSMHPALPAGHAHQVPMLYHGLVTTFRTEGLLGSRPTTKPDLIASNQKRRTCGSAVLPQRWSITMSTEIT